MKPSKQKNNLSLTLFYIRKVIVYTVLVILTILCCIPFIILLVNCTRSHNSIQQGFSLVPGTFFVSNFQAMEENLITPIFKAFFNSIVIALGTAICATYFSALTAYALHEYKFKLKKAATAFILAVMMIPTQVVILGFFNLVIRMDLKNSFLPLILPSIASPVIFFYMKQYLDSVLPEEMIEAARVDGAGEVRIFHGMVLPIMKPAIAVQFIFAFVASWNNYFTPSFILTDSEKKTLPLLMATLTDTSNPQTFNQGANYVCMTIAIIPLIIMYLILSKFIIKGVTLGSVKG